MPAPKKNVIKSNKITDAFQKFLNGKDIRYYKKNLFYYFLFRIVRVFLNNDIIIKIYNFRVHGSIKKNNTSYFLLKKCEFGDYHEMNTISRFSKNKKIFLIDCGCNYGFYSLYVASLSERNHVISIEASKKTSDEFLKNKKLNDLNNITFFNNAVSNKNDVKVPFNESENDWESSISHSDFKSSTLREIKTCTIDTLAKNYDLKEYSLFIKLDIEGNEMNAIQGGLETIKKFSPIIIIEFSKFIFDKKDNLDYLNNFLTNFNYKIYDTNKNVIEVDEIINKINQLTKRHKTIGNFYLIKNSSKQLELFKKDD